MSYNLRGLMGQNSACILGLSQHCCVSQNQLWVPECWLSQGLGTCRGISQSTGPVSPPCLLCPCTYLVCYIEACTTDECILEWHHADSWGGILIWPSKQKKGGFNSSAHLFNQTALCIHQQSFAEFWARKIFEKPLLPAPLGSQAAWV